jgi:hypothetical protein
MFDAKSFCSGTLAFGLIYATVRIRGGEFGLPSLFIAVLVSSIVKIIAAELPICFFDESLVSFRAFSDRWTTIATPDDFLLWLSVNSW